MNTKEALKIVNILHAGIPSDKKATPSDLFARAETYAITMADEDYETVEAAAHYLLRTSKWYPAPAEILEAVKRVKLDNSTAVTPITTAEPVTDEKLNEWLDAFCEWLGFDCEENPTALDDYYDQHPEQLAKMREVFHYGEE